MLAQEIIRRKRQGAELTPDEVESFIAGIANGGIGDAQIGAFAMAVCLKGMSARETADLTRAMAVSGDTLNWSDLDRPVADKHSTGGVGDNVSLMLAPIAAACGLAVPMISGRGLGHTGGTLDKLEAIPGYSIAPEPSLLRRTVLQAGCAIVGQTASLAPADKRLYAIRDVTGTVDSLPLITASILSKKLAAGLSSLVLDVKLGNGAFMQSREEAEALAHSLVDVACQAGLPTRALITDMNEPLADAAGNAVELLHCLDFLRGEKPGTRIETVVMALAAEMLVQAGIAASLDDARAQAQRALDSGTAAEAFSRMVHLLGGPADLIERPRHYLAEAPVIAPVKADGSGWIVAVETRAIGMAVIELGGGRRNPEDRIDHRVGFSALAPRGRFVEAGETLALVHAADTASYERASASLRRAYRLGDEQATVTPVVISTVSG